MVTTVASPRKSINTVFQRFAGGSSQKKRKYDVQDDYEGEGTVEMVQIRADRTKSVLILMSDTGGGHRASAEAIRDAFRLEFGDECQIRGFETQMEKWMGACDCIITKEKGNVPYVVDSGAGVFTRSPKETAKLVAEWFSTKTDEPKRMSENSLKLAQPDAVFDIVKDIHELSWARI